MKAQKMKKKKADPDNFIIKSYLIDKVAADLRPDLNTKYFVSSSISDASINFTHVDELTSNQKFVVFSIDKKLIESGIKFLNRKTEEKIIEKFGPVFKEVITNLLRARDYLGLQLDFEHGNISEKEFGEVEGSYLIEQKNISPDILKKYAGFLINVTGNVFNSEEISTMFNCSAEQAEQAINCLLIEKRDS